MQIIDYQRNALLSLPVHPVTGKQIKTIGSMLAQKIIHELAQQPMYPMALAKKLKVHEQKIYYHIRKLEIAGIIEVLRKEEVHGTTAAIYALKAPAFVYLLKEFSQTHKVPGLQTQPSSFLSPFIENGELNATIIVGSPDPHGPDMARSRDGYYGIDLALFFGTFLSRLQGLHVRLDTEVRSEDLQKNLILIGGPVVNIITQKVNDSLPIRFDKKHNWAIVSTLSKKIHHADECGIIIKVKNPFNSKKWILVVAGKRYAGTRAVTIALLNHFDELVKGNSFVPGIHARVVEGLDRNADGIVDDAVFVE